MDFEKKQLTGLGDYEGNGWSKYQLLVLQTLTDHTSLIKSVHDEINELKKQAAVDSNEMSNWRKNYDSELDEFRDNCEEIKKKVESVDHRLKNIEDDKILEKRVTIRNKATWGALGGLIIVVVDIVLKALGFFFK